MLAMASLAAVFCVGCANPGPPKPPSLYLPDLVKDLSAERVGDHVVLRWTTPSRTTDDMPIKGAITAEICRESGATTLLPSERQPVCPPIRRLEVTPGVSELSDTLPAALQAEPVLPLTYRVQLLNAAGRSAGKSTGALAAAGAAPAPVTSLLARASERGAIIEWQTSAVPGTTPAPVTLIDLKRMDLSNPAAAEKKVRTSNKGPIPGMGKSPQPANSQDPRVTHLRAADSASQARNGTAGTVDPTTVVGASYTYIAERVRILSIGNHTLEISSEPSTAVTVEMRDTFPPAVPTRLATISGYSKPESAGQDSGSTAYVDLSWDPNAERDLAGYRIYRQLAAPDGSPQGPISPLTDLPVATPAYRDVAVKAGQGYIYSVTAVDEAGNESAPSAKASETISPNLGDRSH